MLSIGIVAAFITLFLFSIGDTLAKNVAVALGSYRTALYIVVSGAVPITLIFILYPPANFAVITMVISGISGIFLTMGYFLVYISLRTEQASNTWALINIVPAALILFGIFALAEPVSVPQALCMLAILGGALMVTITKEMKFNRQLIPAIAGELCFIGFIIPAAYGITTYGGDFTTFFFVPRIIAVVLLSAYVLLQPKRLRAEPSERRAPRLWGINPRKIAIVSGLLDGTAQIPFMIVIMSGVVALGGAITAFEPMLVVVLSYFIYKERLTPLQGLGILVSSLGAIAIGMI